MNEALMTTEVLGELGTGGFGRVEHVRLSDGRIGARKTFAPRDPANDTPKIRKRFRREARVQAQLPPEIAIPIIALGLDDDPPWFVMEVADRSLDSLIKTDRDSKTISRDALADVLAALETLHDLDYVHRDLRPQNVMLHRGRWKLTDFGLVLPLSTESTTLTHGSTMGNFFYMAPEQVDEFHFVDSRADLYAVGCILHDWVVGRIRTPYQQHRPTGPFGNIIAKATSVDPAQRYNSVRELRDDAWLELALTGDAIISATGAGANWRARLSGASAWTRPDLIELLRYVSDDDVARDERIAIFRVITSATLENLKMVDLGVWMRIALWYCSFAGETSFQFAECDHIVQILQSLSERGSVTLQSSAILAAARLGTAHNRWYVMQRLVRMAGPDLDERTARRVALEIQNSEVLRDAFAASASRINERANKYHSIIAAALA